jgi:hypothetical protein
VALSAVVALTACGGADAPEGDAAAQVANPPTVEAAEVDPCSLLTGSEIEQVVGTKVERSEPSQYGGTLACNYYGTAIGPVASLLLAGGMPAVSNSTEMAAWRSKQAGSGSYADIKFIIEPVEGLGFPAIRNEIEGAGLATVEVAVRGRLLDVSTGNLEHSKALALKAIARMP